MEYLDYRARAYPGAKKDRPRCGAKTALGEPCQAQGLMPSGRCFRHGGMSTGPSTAEGQARGAAASKVRMARVCQERREGRRSWPKHTKRIRPKAQATPADGITVCRTRIEP